MKYASLKILAILSAIVIVSPARAGHAESSDAYFDKAKLISAVPIYKTICVRSPRQECRQVPVNSCQGGYAGSRAVVTAYPQAITQCDTFENFHDEEVIDGYNVKYRYNGRVYHTRTENDPGKRMQVRVSVVPSEY